MQANHGIRANSAKLRWLFTALVVVVVFSPLYTSNFNLPPILGLSPSHAVSKVYAKEVMVEPAAPAKSVGPHTAYTLSGFVHDAANNPISATIEITPATGLTVTTGPSGNYSVSLEQNLYDVLAVPDDHCLAANTATIDLTHNTVQNFLVNRKVDQFGHICYTEAMQWIAGTNQVNFPNPTGSGQVYTTALPLNFDFRFYSGPESRINILQDGFVTFGPRENQDRNRFANTSIPDVFDPNYGIYAWWNIINLPGTSNTGVYTSVVGTAPNRKLAIEWRNVKLGDGVTTVSFEIVLQEGVQSNTTGNIWVNYQNDGGNNGRGLAATSGIEALPDYTQVPVVNDGIQFAFNEPVLTNGLAVHYYLPPQGTIHGRVLDKHTPGRDPLGATVQILGTSHRATTLSTDGRFTLSASVGQYTVQASARRYLTATQAVTITANSEITLTDFLLGSPVVDPEAPAYTNMWTYVNTTKTYSFTVNDLGEQDMPWILREALDNGGGGLLVKSGSGGPLPNWAIGSLSDPHAAHLDAPASPITQCITGTVGVKSSRLVYEDANVVTKPGWHTQANYTFETSPPHAAPNTAPAHILMYSDDQVSEYAGDGINPPDLNHQLPARALCQLGYRASVNAHFDDVDGFWSDLNNPLNQWDIVVISLEIHEDFGGDQGGCHPTCAKNHWPELKSYYDGRNGRPAGKVVMSTWDIGGTEIGGSIPDAVDFFTNRMGGIVRAYDVNSRNIYLWPLQQRDQFYTTPYTITSITNLNVYDYSSKHLTYMDTNDIIGECKAGFNSTTPIPGGCGLIASYDGRGVLASFRLSEDNTEHSFGAPYHPVKWWCNMINQVVSPPINFGDIPWISENPFTGVSTANNGNPSQVVFTIDATNIHTRTITPLSGYLYLGTNDPHVAPVGVAIPLSLTVIMLNDPTPTPAPPPLVDLTVRSITVQGAGSPNPDHPTVNIPATVTVGISNVGSIAGTSQFAVDVFYDPPITPTLGMQCIPIQGEACYQSRPALQGGGSVIVTFHHTFTTPGVHKIWVIVNTDLSQREPTQVLGNNVGEADACVATRPGQTFNDTLPSNIFYLAIEHLACHGVVQGIGGGLFAPNTLTTRGQFAKMVIKGFNFPLYTPTTPTFHDVPNTYFAYVYIETMVHVGITSGYTQAQCQAAGAQYPCFLPNKTITRGELAAFIWKGKWRVDAPWAATPVYFNLNFSDVPTTYFAYIPIKILTYYGVLSGFTPPQCAAVGAAYPCYLPNTNGSRGQLSQMLYKSLTRP